MDPMQGQPMSDNKYLIIAAQAIPVSIDWRSPEAILQQEGIDEIKRLEKNHPDLRVRQIIRQLEGNKAVSDDDRAYIFRWFNKYHQRLQPVRHGGLINATWPTLERLETSQWRWIGVVKRPEQVEETTEKAVMAQLDRWNVSAVFISPTEHDQQYGNVANGGFWPLLHSAINYAIPAASILESIGTYISVGRKLAEAVARQVQKMEEQGKEVLVWWHDYQILGALLTFPEVAKKMGLNPPKLAYFHHIPVVSPEYLAQVPRKDQSATLTLLRILIDSITNTDTAAFQTIESALNFIGLTRQHVPDVQRTDGDLVTLGWERISVDNKKPTTIRVNPISIKVDQFSPFLARLQHLKEAAQFLNDFILPRTKGQRILYTVGRADYTKGFPETIKAYSKLLDDVRDLKGKVVLVLQAPPTRTGNEIFARFYATQIVLPVAKTNISYGLEAWKEVAEFIEQRTKHGTGFSKDGTISKINKLVQQAQSAPTSWQPIILNPQSSTHRGREIAWRLAADILLMPSLIDGMGLVLKEDVIIQQLLGMMAERWKGKIPPVSEEELRKILVNMIKDEFAVAGIKEPIQPTPTGSNGIDKKKLDDYHTAKQAYEGRINVLVQTCLLLITRANYIPANKGRIGPAVFIIGQGAGASHEMLHAVKVQPTDTAKYANALWYSLSSLTSRQKQVYESWRALFRQVVNNDGQSWMAREITQLINPPKGGERLGAQPSDLYDDPSLAQDELQPVVRLPERRLDSVTVEHLKNTIANAHSKGRPIVIITAYDGVITPFVENRNKAHLSETALQLLDSLSRTDGVAVAIITGRSKDPVTTELAKALPHVFIGIENGAVSINETVERSKEEKAMINLAYTMLHALRNKRKLAVAAGMPTPIERKKLSVVFHTRNILIGGTANEEELSNKRQQLAQELADDLENHLIQWEDKLKVSTGNMTTKVVLHNRAHKGRGVQKALSLLLEKLTQNYRTKPPFVIVIGGDRNDASMFRTIEQRYADAIAIRVEDGRRTGFEWGTYSIDSPQATVNLLQDILGILRNSRKAAQSTALEAIERAAANGLPLLLVLDYDGTLKEFTKNPDNAVPETSLLEMLKQLDSLRGATVYILTGRGNDSVTQVLAQSNINVLIEHGAARLGKAGNPQLLITVTDGEKELLKLAEERAHKFLQQLGLPEGDKTSVGYWIERKLSSVVVHLRRLDPTQFSNSEKQELAERITEHLKTNLANTSIPIIIETGRMTAEIKIPGKADKGSGLQRIMKGMGGKRPFLVMMGDDTTDREMFYAARKFIQRGQLHPESLLIQVGSYQPDLTKNASLQLETPAEARNFLKKLANTLQSLTSAPVATEMKISTAANQQEQEHSTETAETVLTQLLAITHSPRSRPTTEISNLVHKLAKALGVEPELLVSWAQGKHHLPQAGYKKLKNAMRTVGIREIMVRNSIIRNPVLK